MQHIPEKKGVHTEVAVRSLALVFPIRDAIEKTPINIRTIIRPYEGLNVINIKKLFYRTINFSTRPVAVFFFKKELQRMAKYVVIIQLNSPGVKYSLAIFETKYNMRKQI
jgi:hypothetical protein